MEALGQSSNDGLQKLYDHLPSCATNDELEKLQIVGNSVFESEKAHVRRLISDQQLKESGMKQGPKMRLVWHKVMEENPN